MSTESEGQVRKLSRVGGSVVVALPKAVRREVNLGVGDRVELQAVEKEYIILTVKERVRREDTIIRD